MFKNITDIDLKILSLFTVDYSRVYTIRHITQELDINYSHAFHRINELVRMQILLSDRRGHANYISANVSNLDTIKLICYIEESKGYGNPSLTALIKAVTAEDPFACIGLFGSRVSGKATKSSDWDVFIITTKRKSIEALISKFSYMKDIQVQVFDVKEFMDSLLSTEETVVKHILKNKQIIYNPHPFYNITLTWERIKYAPTS